MTDARVRGLLIVTVLVMSSVPPIGAFYLLDRSVQTSLNLGFNAHINEGLDIGTDSLKLLRRFDPEHQDEYRSKFETLVDLKRIYSQPEWIKSNIMKPLRIYFGIGLVALVLLAALIATLLSRRVAGAYRLMLSELISERERVRYLKEMESWQELARVLAHEIKNPLTPVEVLVSALDRAYVEKSPESFRRQLSDTRSMIGEELAHLKRTVNRFSEFSRLPKADLLRERPAEVVRQHVVALTAAHPECVINVRTHDLPDATYVAMDVSLFRHVLTNLISNGIEANPGHKVTFTIHISQHGDAVEIGVLNDGEPVPLTLAESLFEPYVSERRSKENLGLGLAIVKRIVTEHGGSIRYVEQDRHPMFVISLPVAK